MWSWLHSCTCTVRTRGRGNYMHDTDVINKHADLAHLCVRVSQTKKLIQALFWKCRLNKKLISSHRPEYVQAMGSQGIILCWSCCKGRVYRCVIRRGSHLYVVCWSICNRNQVIDSFLMGRGLTSGEQESGSVFSAAVCKIQASKHYIKSISKKLLLPRWKVPVQLPLDHVFALWI